MERLTSNKDVSEMNMYELAHNSCYIKDGKARIRDFEDDFDAKELAGKLLEKYADIPDDFTCNDDFDEFMMDSLQYGTDDMLGLIAVFYRNLWAMADLRETLKHYEDLQKQGKLLMNAGQNNNWILCSERTPENEQDVEITYIRKHYLTGEKCYHTTRAFYEDGTLTTENSAYCWHETDNWEYDEKTDSCIIPEGWFESVDFTEESGIVDMPVIAWRPLSEPYREE